MQPAPFLFLLSLSSVAAGPLFTAQTIDDKISIGYGLAIGDVDGDGKPDILLADAKEIVWYQNPAWKKSVIAKNLTLHDNVCLAARDLERYRPILLAVLVLTVVAGLSRVISWAAFGPPPPLVVALFLTEVLIPPGLILWLRALRRPVPAAERRPGLPSSRDSSPGGLGHRASG